MFIINTEEWRHLSVLVGVCTETSCTFFADQRSTRTLKDGTTAETKDDAQKIFKVNDRLLYGVTGFLPDWEPITGPLDGLQDTDRLNADDLLGIIIEYLNANELRLRDAGAGRIYVIGGVNRDGEYCIYKLHVSVSTYEIFVDEVNPAKDGHPIGIIYCTPPSLSTRLREFESGLSDTIQSSDAGTMNENVAAYIREQTKDDPWVGGEIQCLVV